MNQDPQKNGLTGEGVPPNHTASTNGNPSGQPTPPPNTTSEATANFASSTTVAANGNTSTYNTATYSTYDTASSNSQPLSPTSSTAPAMTTTDPIFTNGNSSVVGARSSKKTGLIVAIIIVLLLLIGGGCAAAWYFLVYNNPANIALEAVQGFLKEKDVVTTGTLKAKSADSDEDVEISLSTAHDGLAAGTSNISFKYQSDDQNIDLDAGSVAMSDGVLYLKVNNIADMFNQYLESNGVTAEDLPESDQMAYQLIKTFDGEWWQISVPDIIDQFVSENNAELGNSSKKFFNCLIDAANEDINGELAELYRKNSFINIEKVSESADGKKKAASGNSLYQVSFDYEKMANFINAIPNMPSANKAYACYNDYYKSLERQDIDLDSSLPSSISAADFDEITARDLSSGENRGKANYYLEISNWGHQLKGLYFVNQSEDYDEAHMDLVFQYKPVTVSAPESYRPITDLVEDLLNIVMSRYLGFDVDYDWEYDPEIDDWTIVDEIDLDTDVDLPLDEVL